MSPLSDALRDLLAEPREAGTPDAFRAREVLTRELAARGYVVETQSFNFTTTILDAFPAFGAGLGLVGLLEWPLLVLAELPRWAALAVWLAGFVTVFALAVGVARGAMARLTDRRRDANLIARRHPDAKITRWIVAHFDTKAQGHSMAGRLVAVWVVGAGVVSLSAAALTRLGGPLPAYLVTALVGLALVGGALAGQGKLRGRSAGARDNGTGLVAALAAAEANTDPGTGILLTGAEEFGLAGAKAFAASRILTGTVAINFDTLDDAGTVFLVTHNDAGRRLAGDLTPVLAGAGHPVRQRKLPLGIFVDSYPLAAAGASSVTVGRLNWATLRRIHTPSDTPAGLSWDPAQRLGAAVGAWSTGGPAIG